MITVSVWYIMFALGITAFVSAFCAYWLGKDVASKELFHVKRRLRDAESRLHLLTQRQQWLGD